MRFPLRKCVALSSCAFAALVCSCEEHQVGEDPQVQREGLKIPAKEIASTVPASPTPAAKPTPVEFFPTKP